MSGRREPPDRRLSLEEILDQSRTVSERLATVTGRLEQAVDRLVREIEDTSPPPPPRRHREETDGA